jgi:hypothetical protein
MCLTAHKNTITHSLTYEDGTDCVPKHQHLNSTRWRTTQKKTYDIVIFTWHCCQYTGIPQYVYQTSVIYLLAQFYTPTKVKIQINGAMMMVYDLVK